MGAVHRFLATVEEAGIVLDWFRSLDDPPVESPRERGSLLCFRDCGPLGDAKNSPLVSIFLPVRKRGVLTTVGEVHFNVTPLTKCPRLARESRRFRKWLQQYPCIYSRRPAFVGEWDYYLEGGVRDWDSDIYALPEGMAALRRGAYFVSDNDSDQRLDLVCRALELRAVEGIEYS